MPTPLQTATNGAPLSWVGANSPVGGTTEITIAPAMYNYQQDQNLGAPPFTSPLSPAEETLLHAAAHVWELVANIHFDWIDDTAPQFIGRNPIPDIRVGLSTLTEAGRSNLVGLTDVKWVNNIMAPDATVAIEDPAEHPVVALADDDFGYKGTTTTMWQSMIHELGHALGLDHNPLDPTSLMNPVLTRNNPLPDNQDIAAIQSLYGAPTKPLNISEAETSVLAGLFDATIGNIPSG